MNLLRNIYFPERLAFNKVIRIMYLLMNTLLPNTHESQFYQCGILFLAEECIALTYISFDNISSHYNDSSMTIFNQPPPASFWLQVDTAICVRVEMT